MDTKKENYIEKNKNQSFEEQAIDKTATDGEQINHQVENKKEQHQPRDTA